MKSKYTKSIVVEGIYYAQEISDVTFNNTGDFLFGKGQFSGLYILYAGSMDQRQGVETLIRAFQKLVDAENDMHLFLCGQGPEKEYLEEQYLNSTNVSFLNPLPRSQLFNLMKSAVCLVIPIDPNNEFARYFFPSKLIEYLASGAVTCMYRLPCVSADYLPYIAEIDDSSGKITREEEMVIALSKIVKSSVEERRRFGDAARHFILKKKDSVAWGKKLKQWLEI